MVGALGRRAAERLRAGRPASPSASRRGLIPSRDRRARGSAEVAPSSVLQLQGQERVERQGSVGVEGLRIDAEEAGGAIEDLSSPRPGDGRPYQRARSFPASLERALRFITPGRGEGSRQVRLPADPPPHLAAGGLRQRAGADRAPPHAARPRAPAAPRRGSPRPPRGPRPRAGARPRAPPPAAPPPPPRRRTPPRRPAGARGGSPRPSAPRRGGRGCVPRTTIRSLSRPVTNSSPSLVEQPEVAGAQERTFANLKGLSRAPKMLAVSSGRSSSRRPRSGPAPRSPPPRPAGSSRPVSGIHDRDPLSRPGAGRS